MNREELNSAALLAKADDSIAWDIKAHYMPLIEKLTAANWHKMNNEGSFIEDCYRRIDYAIRSFDRNRGSFDKRVQSLIGQAVREYCGRRGNRRKNLVSFEFNAEKNEGDRDTFSLALEDTSVHIAEEVEATEGLHTLIDELCEGCDKKRFVLVEISRDNYNKSDIARKLASTYGTKENSERIFVRRFLDKLGKGA